MYAAHGPSADFPHSGLNARSLGFLLFLPHCSKTPHLTAARSLVLPFSWTLIPALHKLPLSVMHSSCVINANSRRLQKSGQLCLYIPGRSTCVDPHQVFN